MNVLIIPTGGMGLDGITLSVLNYYRNFNHKDLNITFVITKRKCESKYIDSFIKEIESNNDKVIEIRRNKKIFKYFFKLIKLMKKEKFDIVHLHGSSSLLAIELFAAKISGIKTRIVHSHNTTCDHKVLNLILKPIFNFLTTYRLACGVDAGKWLFGNYKFDVIRNGINVEKFDLNKNIRKRIREELNLEEFHVIGHVGSFNIQKNHNYLIDLFYELNKKYSNYKLVLVGDGELRKEIEKKVENYKLKRNVLFLGRKENVNELLQAFDLMILPSLYEGLPLVAIEWQAAGLPVLVSSNVTKEINITNLVKFENLTSEKNKWISKIVAMKNLERKSRKDEIKDARYDIVENSKMLVNLYENLLNKGRYKW